MNRLDAVEHASHPGRREETLPKISVLDLRRKISQGLGRPGERPPRLANLPAPLVELADLGRALADWEPHCAHCPEGNADDAASSL